VGEHKGEHETMEYILMGVSALVAFSGIFLASRAYLKKLPEPFYSLSFNKWYVDEIYNFLFVNGLVKGGGTLMSRFDASVVDGGVNGAGWLTRFTATLSVWWDTWIVDGAVRLSGFVVKVFSYPVRLAQTGFVQSYALVILFGAAGVLAYALFR
jgi:NADH-quinone oxidoreductase subunit L